MAPRRATLSTAARKAARRERLDAANRCVAAEIARVARKICDELKKARDVIADARVDEDGQIAITTAARRRRMRAKGLVACAGCGQFYAVHGGGLRQHWAMGGVSDACAAAAEGARSPYMTDEEALVAIRGKKLTKTNSRKKRNNRMARRTREPAPRTAAGAGAVRAGPARGASASPRITRSTRV